MNQLESFSGEGVSATYSRDNLGQLKSVTLNDQLISYALDWDGRRVAKRLNGVNVSRHTFESPLRVAMEIDVAGTQRHYVYGSGINSPDYMILNGENFRLIKDHLGSPRLVISANTGTIVQRMDFNEWGEVLFDSNPGFQGFGFAGGLYDQDTKLVKFGARDYDPRTGRWLSKDPILLAGGDANLYGYVLQDPVNFFDPKGESRSVADVPIRLPDGAGPGKGGGGPVKPGNTIYVAPNGQAVVAPQGSSVGTANNGAGLKVQLSGSKGGSNTVRLMEPTNQYPNGYGRIQNSAGQYVDKNGNPVSKDDEAGHICPK